MCIHPLAEVANNLLARALTVECLKLGPLRWLSLADEGQDCFTKDGLLTVEAVTVYGT